MSVRKYDMALRPDWPKDWPQQMVGLEDYNAVVTLLDRAFGAVFNERHMMDGNYEVYEAVQAKLTDEGKLKDSAREEPESA